MSCAQLIRTLAAGWGSAYGIGAVPVVKEGSAAGLIGWYFHGT